jgi:hypothetical protein
VTHYDTLRVSPSAEDAVIRASYRALMRLYHPDTNDDPEAQARAREITAAFAVIGDPAKRAAYDALWLDSAGEEAWLGPDLRPPPPMRNLGVAAVVLALGVSLVFAVSPKGMGPVPHELRRAAPDLKAVNVATALRSLAAQEPVTAKVEQAASVPPRAQAKPNPPPASRAEALPAQSVGPPPPPVSTTKIAAAIVARKPVAIAVAAGQTPSSSHASEKTAPATCGDGCTDDRRAQVERMATAFLKQSMDHADWYKQQLLLSARNRSATSRGLCHSDDCVTEAYLRQIRETTDIMAGHTPTQ